MSDFDRDWLFYCYDRITDLFLECINVEDPDVHEDISSALQDCIECVYHILGQSYINQKLKEKYVNEKSYEESL